VTVRVAIVRYCQEGLKKEVVGSVHFWGISTEEPFMYLSETFRQMTPILYAYHCQLIDFDSLYR
jgi:hypothetical protein